MTGLNTLLDLIEKEKQAALSRWQGVTTIVERQLMDAAIQWIQDNIQIENGTAIIDKDLPKLLTDLQNTIVEVAVKSKEYNSGITSFLSSIKEIQDNISKLNANVNNINIREVVGPVQNVVVDELIDRLSENGLNAHFAAPLRELVYNKFLAGQNMKEMRASLQEYILGGKDNSGKLHQYITQTVQQGADSVTAATNLAIQDNFKTTGMIISGSLIETSSIQCIYAVELGSTTGGYLTNAQWETVLDIARNNKEAQLIPGTNLKNLDWNKLHWGCRHTFSPILDPGKLDKEGKLTDKESQIKILANKAKVAAPLVDKPAQAIAKKFKADITPINLKTEESILRKVDKEYAGDVTKVKDAVRTTLISQDPNKIPSIIAEIKKRFDVTKVKEQRADTDPLGYSGNLINIKTKTGIIGEIQVNTPEMIYAKEPEALRLIGKDKFDAIKKKTGLDNGLGHTMYEQYRKLPDNADPAERLKLEEKSKKYYEAFR